MAFLWPMHINVKFLCCFDFPQVSSFLLFLGASWRKALEIDNSSHSFPSMNLQNREEADNLILFIKIPPHIRSHFSPFHRKLGRESCSNNEKRRLFFEKIYIYHFPQSTPVPPPECNQDTTMHNRCSKFVLLMIYFKEFNFRNSFMAAISKLQLK